MTQKITYTSLGAPSEEFHRDFAAGLESAQQTVGVRYSNMIGGEPALPPAREIEVRSPIDTRTVLGIVEQATAEQAARAVDLAHEAFLPWRNLGWENRVFIMRRAAELMSDKKYFLAAMMAWETGKNRMEAMGEVEESIDLMLYYSGLMESHAGYEQPLKRVNPAEETRSVLRPYGVWGVISPFNFPMALPVGMITAALVTGNTVVFKPSQDAPITGALLYRVLHEAGVPENALQLVGGTGAEVGQTIVSHPRTEGLAFTGSYEVGMHLFKTFSARYPKPIVVEMGGKNATIVTKGADLEAAAEGVMRSAFGFGGQKCSACSRVYVAQQVKDVFLELVRAKTAKLKMGNPLKRDVFLGPVINQAAQRKYEGYIQQIRSVPGVNVLIGGEARHDGDFAHGWFVEPTIAELPDKDHALWNEEMFLPILLAAPIADLGEGIALANRSLFGLTAGLFSREAKDIRRFLDEIEAGVTYVNRRGGATTGAWPGVNPFGGWKGSGSTGPAALGPHYLLRFMREQSRTTNM